LVENTEEVLAHLEALAIALGGYVSDSRSWRVNEELYASITLRVPAESFDEARRRIKEEGIELQGEETSARDVTEEYTDLEARLKNLQAAEEELRELLRTVRERSTKAEDILEVYRELTNIRGQIEQIQGRMQYLEHAVAMATITVTLTPKEEVQVVEPGWDWLRTVRESLRDLVKALQFLADIATRFIITLLPILIIVALPFAVLGWLVWLWRRRRARKEG
jgi:DNA repair exonuclease SbcCD ATPase subunit